jgi:hypothetical protein
MLHKKSIEHILNDKIEYKVDMIKKSIQIIDNSHSTLTFIAKQEELELPNCGIHPVKPQTDESGLKLLQ